MDLSGFLVAAPSRVAVGEEFTLCIKGLTEPYFVGTACGSRTPRIKGPFNLSPRGISYMDNSPLDWTGTVQLDGGPGCVGPDAFEFNGKQGAFAGDTRPIARVAGLRFDAPGTHFVTVREPRSGIEASSNAIVVTESAPEDKLYWGDIHSQTYFSDGLRCPEELYAFARDEAFLDIFAMADHSEHLSDRQWEYFVGVTNDFNDPGRFVTLVGFEWTCHHYGHRNVYYRGDRGPILRCNDPVERELDHVFEVARQHGALVIPHHSANVQMGVTWEFGHDPEVERLVEIYSVWGNSERPGPAGNPCPIRHCGGEQAGRHVLDALRLGRRLGFVGGGDIHDGRPGDDLHNRQLKPDVYRMLWRQGAMAVRAKELTREAIFDALWRRQTYATTNCRIYLDFTVCGQPMGSQIEANGPRPVHARAASEQPIASIEIVRNGEDWARAEPHHKDAAFDVDDEASDPAYYYARITRTDGQMAWSSPVWVDG